MYAIVDIAGQQFKVEKGQEVFVHRLDGDEGASMEFDKVLLVDNDGKVSIGTPVVEGAKIGKKKRRKGYQKASGHRQDLSKVLIESITV